ncbi:hypothetical protein M406DRAFT_65644 [Cryphonectria parasitica EP155]|uniref:Tyrosinase copper-binding domain-containing protein n=1 Tax=Cryphonectria parasitica (strain ATCC 38755 / EP155) TaxID=660469 RepID=A0A9P5CTQ7_CRYP1|nr:uncharacterized protein M406DRAFT_65644 [Cryphonectria parasitica EP155]KAF3769370.1 hypothetical protein M406DRAFT_65644 [Cryphonectria parasitica EP155]
MMKVSAVFFSLALAATEGASVPTASDTRPTFFNGSCNADTLTIRKEWRNLSDDEKKAFLDAENYLINTAPAQTALDGVISRFSDLQGLHRFKTNTTIDGVYVQDIIHNVGQFLPWHRYFLHTHEVMLRTQANYTGPIPWWDEELDANAGDLFRSNMWSADAFGTNGVVDLDDCVIDGAFANMTEHIGPGLDDTEYCFTRSWTSDYIQWMTTANIETCTQHNDYYTFMNCMVEFTTSPHVAGHNSSGGIVSTWSYPTVYSPSPDQSHFYWALAFMADIMASPGDPVFFLHHGHIDRMWWNWQTANASSRLFDMSGNAFNYTYLEEHGTTLPSGINPNTTLNYTLNVANILPDIPIEQVMNAQGGLLCYEYDY